MTEEERKYISSRIGDNYHKITDEEAEKFSKMILEDIVENGSEIWQKLLKKDWDNLK